MECRPTADHHEAHRAGREPTELYERPATDFVHGFLDQRRCSRACRCDPTPSNSFPSRRDRGDGQSIMELGFEVQVTVALSDGTAPWVQMSRNEFRNLHVEIGSLVSIRERD